MLSPRSFLIIVSFLLHSLLYGAEVSPEQAQAIAARFLQQSSAGARLKAPELSLSYTRYFSTSAQARQESKPLYYVFNVAEGGFVMVSADDAAYPILGFSERGAFATESLPQAYVKWVAAYEKQLKALVQQQPHPTARVVQAWESLEIQSTTVGPLLTSTWNQSPYYNEHCPYDASAQEHAVTGCVATAMAQLMKYHQHPQKGTGFHVYSHSTYGTLPANFGLTEYAWEQMPDAVYTSNEAVAQLNYHCGVSVNMDYGVHESGAAGAVMVRPALRKYFQYEAELAQRQDYSTPEWISLLKEELDAGRPVYYEGSGTGGGHAFVCDGYQGDEFFHFNWGWGGFMDGFYYIDDLNPADQGTGGGSGSYNSNQKIVYGIQPADAPVAIAYELELHSETQVNPNPVPFTYPFEVDFSVANFGDVSFNGQFALVVFDENNFQEVIDSMTVSDLSAQAYLEVTLTTGGLPVAAPGNYQLAILYKEEGQEWQLVDSGSYPVYTNIEILDSDNDIVLSRPLNLSSETLIQDEAFDLSFNVEHTGLTTFSGTLFAALYNFEGEFQELIGSVDISSLPSGDTFTGDLIISSPGVEVEPGTYLLAMWSADIQDTLLLAGGAYTHPLKVVVQAPPLLADAYEDNDSEAHAYLLVDAMETESLNIKTRGANQHTDVDYDYYRLSLPAGYRYKITARLQDEYDSNDGQQYTNDVVLSYKQAGEWTEAFDTGPDSAIVLSDGGTLTFWIAPYFAGQQGTYALDLQIIRQEHPAIALANANWDTLMLGATQLVEWESNFTEPVTLALYHQDHYHTPIAEAIANTGHYSWVLADSLTPADQYQLFIYSSSDTTIRSGSASFTIAPMDTASLPDSTEAPASPAEPDIDMPDTVTGLANEQPHLAVMYPNPVRERLFLHFENKLPDLIEVANVQGIVLRKLEWHSGQSWIDLAELPPGLYLLRCRWADGNPQTYTLLKE